MAVKQIRMYKEYSFHASKFKFFGYRTLLKKPPSKKESYLSKFKYRQIIWILENTGILEIFRTIYVTPVKN